ncbi:MAG: CocE/NonD family hydrolase [Chitinophagaceae bacterium]
MKYTWLAISLTCFLHAVVKSQTNSLYSDLPVGKYPVGFKIVTITDSSRVTKPLYNYFGEKEKNDRFRKVTIHTWYPSLPKSGKEKMSFTDYCYSDALNSLQETISVEEKNSNIKNAHESLNRFFGKTEEGRWQDIIQTKMLASKEAAPATEKFPLLVGMLRPLSTTVTNELLASNGYVVAMVVSDGGRWPAGYISDITDMQKAITYLSRAYKIDPDHIGTFGFSGSGFSQLLLAMNDPRIAAYADIESALYGQGVADILSSSDYYDTDKLRVPFLHIYGRELAKSDVKFDDFLKSKYSNRYHLSLNYPGLHHWDVATEGRISTNLLHLRGENEKGITASFELCNTYLLHFFNSVLKHSGESQKILDNRAIIKGYADSLLTFKYYDAIKQPPDRKQFSEYISRNGIEKGIQLAREFHGMDSNTAFIHENDLNRLSQEFAEKSKPQEAIELMKLAIEFHPGKAWLWNNLASTEEDFGKKDDAIRDSEKVVEMLNDFKGEPSSFDGRIRRSAVDRLARLKKN